MGKRKQPSSQGAGLVSRQPLTAPDSRGDQVRDVRGVAPVVEEDHWWAQHWVGGGSLFGRISSPASSAPSESGSPAAVASTPSHSTGPPTYSSATREGRGSAKAEHAEIMARLALLPANLLDFLKRFNKDGEMCGFYTSKVSWLKQRGCPKLVVDFSHIMQDERDRDLAFTVCNYQKMNRSYLKKAAEDFFNGNGFNIAEPEIEFKNLPRRIYKAKDFLLCSARAESVPLFDGQEKVVMATTHGRRACDVILCGVLDYLIKGISWCGQLTLDDILVIEGADGRLKLMITKKPSIGVSAPDVERLTDLRTTWTGLEPYYFLDGQLPLYFDELKADIIKATTYDIRSDWFHVYIRNHPAFFSSPSRSNFICRVHQDYRSLNLARDPAYGKVFDRRLNNYEWRGEALKSVFSEPVYNYRWRNLSMTEAEKKKNDPRENIMADLLEFNRHCVQHVDNNAPISDVDENELFTAKLFPRFLPLLIKLLLKEHLLSRELASAWSNYQVSKYDPRGPPAQVVGNDSARSSRKSSY